MFYFMTETEKLYRIAISLFKKINFTNLQYIFNYLDSVEDFFLLDKILEIKFSRLSVSSK